MQRSTFQITYVPLYFQNNNFNESINCKQHYLLSPILQSWNISHRKRAITNRQRQRLYSSSCTHPYGWAKNHNAGDITPSRLLIERTSCFPSGRNPRGQKAPYLLRRSGEEEREKERERERERERGSTLMMERRLFSSAFRERADCNLLYVLLIRLAYMLSIEMEK